MLKLVVWLLVSFFLRSVFLRLDLFYVGTSSTLELFYVQGLSTLGTFFFQSFHIQSSTFSLPRSVFYVASFDVASRHPIFDEKSIQFIYQAQEQPAIVHMADIVKIV